MKNVSQILNSKFLFVFQILLLFCFVFSVNAQDSDLSVKAEYEDLNLINEVPKHLPIKIEIINGKSEDVLSDVKIKVTNTGAKPIYYLKFFISSTKDFLSPRGDQYGFPMRYGRAALITFTELANETDVPLKKASHIPLKLTK